MTIKFNTESPYRKPAVQIISCVESNIICSSADGSFDNWIDDGEVCNPGSSLSDI